VLDSPVHILSASLRAPKQVSRAIADGAHGVTVPMSVLMQLSDHPLSESVIAETERAVVKRS